MRTLASASIMVFLAACSSESGNSDSSGDAGTSGTSTIAESCAPACSTVDRCYREESFPGTMDVDGCVAQCKLEVAGNGHLHPDVAKLLFGYLASADVVSCHLLVNPGAWGFDQVFYQNGYRGVPSPERLEECTDKYMKACGADEDINRSQCFLQVFRKQEDVWAKAEACYAKGDGASAESACETLGGCFNESVGILDNRQPWLGPTLAIWPPTGMLSR